MEIYGLNERQRKIADLLWSIETKDGVHTFIDGMPPDLKQDANLVLNMMILAVIDECTDTTEAEQVLERFK
jgi:hypothetical protein